MASEPCNEPRRRGLVRRAISDSVADNAILFTAIEMLFDRPRGDWYVSALQASFSSSRSSCWRRGSAFSRTGGRSGTCWCWETCSKAAGAGLMLVGVEPMTAYALVGKGAAIYGPAKYGILPELVGADRLVCANGWIEGSTIVAIVGDSAVGLCVAGFSVAVALVVVMACYAVSAAATLALLRLPAAQQGAERVLRSSSRVCGRCSSS